MKIILSFLLALTLSESFAEEINNIGQMLDSITLEKKEVESMVDKLVESGRITAEDGAKAKREIASMKNEDLELLKNTAINEIKEKNLLNK